MPDEQTVRFRATGPDDGDLAARATLGNVNWCGPRFTMEQVVATATLAHYFTPWPKDGDLGLVAETTEGAPVGIAWLRFFDAADPGFGYVADSVPELSIWVDQATRGTGVGTDLLVRLVELARSSGIARISLSVEEGNRARVLHERVGFARPGADVADDTLVLALR